jgi:hypothetical protein
MLFFSLYDKAKAEMSLAFRGKESDAGVSKEMSECGQKPT